MAEMFPVTDHYLHPDAEIVHSPVFESAVVKVSRAGHDATPCISATDELRDVVFLRANLSMVQLKDNTIDNTFLYCNVRALLATQTSNRNRSNRLVTVVSSKICLWERLLEQLLHVLKSQHE
ncbi:hypothetical protein PC119_g14473 [Phytophthora cactorum]|uniref:Uncharacterized protein n=1 Tax=Phytophthora cactorum TaxID=29920 RepID=A0A8T1BX09_9STRA|nr:hypothetical protein PC111_g14101 [Phytophthora cactorum]KAG2852074.1 hypothetical protein PC113_g15341 [Phytophthora cactorum]KAG2909075.1 hypothetical protein PC115_g13370 [Phytophthora cactorum]KAG2917756.1 hypothetical protein PC114_g7009 [Phytophthora cactorum]KAG3007728.1 hypothetical protein PC119_g14473 [Phytophthora cactorum]